MNCGKHELGNLLNKHIANLVTDANVCMWWENILYTWLFAILVSKLHIYSLSSSSSLKDSYIDRDENWIFFQVNKLLMRNNIIWEVYKMTCNSIKSFFQKDHLYACIEFMDMMERERERERHNWIQQLYNRCLLNLETNEFQCFRYKSKSDGKIQNLGKK